MLLAPHTCIDISQVRASIHHEISDVHPRPVRVSEGCDWFSVNDGICRRKIDDIWAKNKQVKSDKRSVDTFSYYNTIVYIFLLMLSVFDQC